MFQGLCFVFCEVWADFLVRVSVACVEIVLDGLDVCLYGVVNFGWYPVGVPFGGVALVFLGFFVAEMAFEYYASEVFIFVIFEVFCVGLAGVR